MGAFSHNHSQCATTCKLLAVQGFCRLRCFFVSFRKPLLYPSELRGQGFDCNKFSGWGAQGETNSLRHESFDGSLGTQVPFGASAGSNFWLANEVPQSFTVRISTPSLVWVAALAAVLAYGG